MGALGLLWSSPALADQPTFDLHEALTAAQPGATITVPPGVYPGPVAIDQPVTLQAEAGAIIDGGGQGDVVVVNAPDVTLRGFIVRNSGDSLDREHAGINVMAPRVTLEQNRVEDALFGIYLKNAPGSVLRDNVVLSKAVNIARRGDGIKVWYSRDCRIEGNQVRGSRDVILWYSPHCVVRNNVVEESRYGLHYMQSQDAVMEHNILRNNSVGVYIMYGRDVLLRNNVIYNHRGPSGFGIGLKDATDVTVTGNRIVGNRVGVYVDNSPPEPDAQVTFEQNLFANNEIGAELLPNVKHNHYRENIFLENGEQVAIAGTGDATGSQWSVAGRGNFWSDYVGFDADGDGVGDLPYRAQSLFENLLSKHPELRLFQLSPAADALDLAARAFPIFQPRPKLADEHPLMAPPALPAVEGLPAAPVAANLALSGALIAIAIALVWFSRPQVSQISQMEQKNLWESVKSVDPIKT
jgi:nitrous oxidase accessory protein